jgi:hypothetical protein
LSKVPGSQDGTISDYVHFGPCKYRSSVKEQLPLQNREERKAGAEWREILVAVAIVMVVRTEGLRCERRNFDILLFPRSETMQSRRSTLVEASGIRKSRPLLT